MRMLRFLIILLVTPFQMACSNDSIIPSNITNTEPLLAAKGFKNLALDVYRLREIEKYKEPAHWTLYFDTTCPPPAYTEKNCNDLKDEIDKAFLIWKKRIISEKKLELKQKLPVINEIDGCFDIARRLQSAFVEYKDQDTFNSLIIEQIADYEACLKNEQTHAFGQTFNGDSENSEASSKTVIEKKKL